MAAARIMGLAGGRLRSAAAAIGAPRLPPFAPHAGRRCPLAAPAPLLGPAAAPADGLLARLAPRAPAHLRRRAPEPDARSLIKIPPFSTGGARSDGGKVGGANGVPGRRDECAGVDKQKTEEDAGSKKAGGGTTKTTNGKDGVGAGGGTTKTTDDKDVVDAGGRTTEVGGGGTTKTTNGKDGAGKGGRSTEAGGGSQAKDAAFPAKDPDAVGNIITKGGGGDSASVEGSNGGEEQLNPAASKNLLLTFAKVVETVLKRILKAEWKFVDKELREHSRRIIYLVLAGVLFELLVVIAAAMIIGTWIGIVKFKQLIKYLTTSPETMAMYQKAADTALELLYNALTGKGRKLLEYLLSIFVATEEGKAGEEDKAVELGKPAGEGGASAGGEGKASAEEEGERTGQGALLMLMMFAIFLF